MERDEVKKMIEESLLSKFGPVLTEEERAVAKILIHREIRRVKRVEKFKSTSFGIFSTAAAVWIVSFFASIGEHVLQWIKALWAMK